MKHKYYWNSNTDFVCFSLNTVLQISICGLSQIIFLRPLVDLNKVSIPKSQTSRHFCCLQGKGYFLLFMVTFLFLKIPLSICNFCLLNSVHGQKESHGFLLRDVICCLTCIWGWGAHKSCFNTVKKAIGIKMFADAENSVNGGTQWERSWLSVQRHAEI